MTESQPNGGAPRSIAVWLAVLAVPMSLVYGLGGILGLVAIALASPGLRNGGDRRTFGTVLLGFFAVALSGCIASALLIGPGGRERPNVLGSVATASLRALDGSTIELADGVRPTIVDVWATWCPPCIAGIPMLEAIHRDLAEEVRVISIAVEPATVVESWLAERRSAVASGELDRLSIPTYPIVASGQPLPELVDATRAYPTLWILDADGRVVQELVGLHDLPTLLALVRAVDSRESTKRPTPSETAP